MFELGWEGETETGKASPVVIEGRVSANSIDCITVMKHLDRKFNSPIYINSSLVILPSMYDYYEYVGPRSRSGTFIKLDVCRSKPRRRATSRGTHDATIDILFGMRWLQNIS
ncbi:hypothetical protein J3458_022184 [Metarhizium acridum]|uniref:uncharacterized protein n=1 Tax=Metarhizium acridum TaxID=92637 RepID=UPI001C6CF097|nr:hypothetical protein J3458_022184 [Metarhizium acridum]